MLLSIISLITVLLLCCPRADALAYGRYSNDAAYEGPVQDSVESLAEIAVVAQLKQRNDLRLEPLSGTTLRLDGIERRQIASLGDFASHTPNLYIPDYGSKITSS